jgi:uncharacterized protein (DUF1800 family)
MERLEVSRSLTNMPPKPDTPWAPYAPSPDNPWNLRKVAHLHRRAGFGATRAELLRDLKAGPESSIDRFFHPSPISAEETEAIDGLRQTARTSSNLDLLKVCWLNRILQGADPLREKLTLFWHGHFATSNVKVNTVALMDQQNETLRTHALGGFGPMLEAMIADPAMLIWLDGATSKKEKPNENFAREYLELFTMSPGHYTETDIREAARAFTGWTRKDTYGFRETPTLQREPAKFDDGTKTFLTKTGRWGPNDIVRITLERPETAVFLARKLYRYFVSEAGPPAPELIEPLAEEIRRQGFMIGPVIRMILRSMHFYSRAVYRQRIKSPVEYSLGLARALEVPRSALNPLALAATCDAQGQELFAPPNVSGWAGGSVWINSGTLLERHNWATDLIWGRAENGLEAFDPTTWAKKHSVPPARAAQAFLDLLLDAELKEPALGMVLGGGRDGTADGERKAIQRMVNCAEFQLA